MACCILPILFVDNHSYASSTVIMTSLVPVIVIFAKTPLDAHPASLKYSRTSSGSHSSFVYSVLDVTTAPKI
ncbi:uncharacterized protein LAESUDRAFT_728048 [Laetiporus sulphureus 93-53]|uniref:Uncharacterized protein n=1 Tax=Laetiporus sulphureus 93-53 TaxID=1314785 RepID=A0A165DCC5_9APHY|nr:uncharacterized protein LAESUDRAFT_728048 [Laetiporus sulphureus 93-53]KZT04549.1 hypothetical protein LAESUDRAFT_728048 [Laetiporus sulphureus 93-53]